MYVRRVGLSRRLYIQRYPERRQNPLASGIIKPLPDTGFVENARVASSVTIGLIIKFEYARGATRRARLLRLKRAASGIPLLRMYIN